MFVNDPGFSIFHFNATRVGAIARAFKAIARASFADTTSSPIMRLPASNRKQTNIAALSNNIFPLASTARTRTSPHLTLFFGTISLSSPFYDSCYSLVTGRHTNAMRWPPATAARTNARYQNRTGRWERTQLAWTPGPISLAAKPDTGSGGAATNTAIGGNTLRKDN
jgi:hypothetical protein